MAGTKNILNSKRSYYDALIYLLVKVQRNAKVDFDFFFLVLSKVISLLYSNVIKLCNPLLILQFKFLKGFLEIFCRHDCKILNLQLSLRNFCWNFYLNIDEVNNEIAELKFQN